MKPKAPSYIPRKTHRFDPYKNYKFRVKWNGKYAAGFNKVGALKNTIELVEHREGGAPSPLRKLPGQTKNEPITLERGITHDGEFEAWAKLIYKTDIDLPTSLEKFRKDLTLEVLDEMGEVAKAYHLNGCWVSEFQALPALDGNANAVAIEMMVLQNEGWKSTT